jgi:TolB-like protein/DNA-binding winged helix-turn-helix (wHTH) protein
MATDSHLRARRVRFATFEVDLNARELRKGGVKIKVHGQPFEVLAMLLERPGEIVPREELKQKLWPNDTFVDFDHGVNTAINRLREALGDSAENPRFVETIPRRGYRFIAPVEPQNTIPDTKAAAQVPAAPIPTDPAVGSARPKKRWVVPAFAVTFGLAVVAVLGMSSLRDRLFGMRGTSNIQSLAVLPLANLSGGPDQDYFAEGLTDALITDLGKISALRVISRTSVMQYKGTKKSLPEIARELNVDALIEGTVLRSGNHLRVTANLVKAEPEKHLWAESYDSEIGDVLVLQSQVAQAVAREIQVKLTQQEKELLGSARPVNPEAHDDYLKGRFLCGKAPEGADNGIQYFQRAIEEAPSDPLAYAGLADCYVIFGWAADISAGDHLPKDGLRKASEATRKALELDSNLAEAHASLAVVELILNWNWTSAEREFKRAIELNPNYSSAHMWYAHYLAAMGRFDESVAEAKRALQLDPFSQVTLDFGEWAFYLARQYDLTLQQSQKSLELVPELPWLHYDIALVYERQGRIGNSTQEFLIAQEQFGLSPERLAELRKAYQESGAKGYWGKMLELCQEKSRQARKFASPSGYGSCDYAQYIDIARMQVHLGEFDAAFKSLERAYSNHEGPLIYLNVDPDWDGVRSDRRFRDLAHRIGLPR